MAPGRRDGLRGFRRAVARRARRTDWPADFLRRHATFKTYRSLHVEQLEERLVWTASALSELISPEWFEDCRAASETAHAGAAGWSAAAQDQTRASVGGAADTYDWIVRFDTAALGGITSAAGTTSLLVGSGIHFDVLRGLGLVGQVLVRSSGASPDEVRAWLSADKDVAGFEQDEVHQLAVLPNDPRRSELWGLDNAGDTDIDAPAAWNLTTGSRNVVVAVVDTGVDYNHPDLAANIWTNPREIAGNGIDDDGNGFVDDVHGYNFVDDTSDPMDDQGHGTHVSGTIGAVGNNGTGVVGVNWSVSIMALKFLDATGSGYTSDAVRAINYATMMRTRYGVNVRVMNHSWGGPGFSAALHDAIQASGNAGILNAVAAGNDAANVDSSPSYPAAYDCSNMLTVAATTSQDQLAYFSNWGTTSVDLAAPGYQILSTVPNNGYATYSGTSMATPHVSGVAALAWALKPDATVAEVRNAILQGADRVAALNGRVATGGRLNAYNTLQLLTPSGPQAPSISTLSVTPGSMTVGAIATITAGGVVDRDGTVTGVSFYQDVNGNGQWDVGDRLLGTDTTIESQTASITLNTAGYAPGSYTVFARAQDNSGQWSSAASASMTLGTPDDHGNDPATATPVSVPSVVPGAIEAGGDQDWFAFQAVAGRSYVFETSLGTLARFRAFAFRPQWDRAWRITTIGGPPTPRGSRGRPRPAARTIWRSPRIAARRPAPMRFTSGAELAARPGPDRRPDDVRTGRTPWRSRFRPATPTATRSLFPRRPLPRTPWPSGPTTWISSSAFRTRARTIRTITACRRSGCGPEAASGTASSPMASCAAGSVPRRTCRSWPR